MTSYLLTNFPLQIAEPEVGTLTAFFARKSFLLFLPIDNILLTSLPPAWCGVGFYF